MDEARERTERRSTASLSLLSLQLLLLLLLRVFFVEVVFLLEERVVRWTGTVNEPMICCGFVGQGPSRKRERKKERVSEARE